jgi:hypothetical protein
MIDIEDREIILRWRATINYRTANGIVDIEHDLEELQDLQELVERGPHWDTIALIRIDRINHNTSNTLTVEQAEKL